MEQRHGRERERERERSTHSRGIGSHYDLVQGAFNAFWSRQYLRYGLWDGKTRSVREALANADYVVAQCLEINGMDRVMDAGCGVGETAILMAKKYGARIVGVNLSRTQLCIARERAARAGVADAVSFEEQDFTRTSFEDSSFTKILAIESVYHLDQQGEFVDEAFRLLAKMGRVAVLDRFLLRRNLSGREQETYARFRRGQSAGPLTTTEEFRQFLASAGFRAIRFQDKLAAIQPSVRKGTCLALPKLIFVFLASRLNILPRAAVPLGLALLAERRLFESGALTYGLFTAEK